MRKYTYHKDILNRNGQVIGRRVDTIPDNIVKQIRADAIDDFVHECDKYCGFYIGKNKILTREDILHISRELKEQK